MRAAWQAKCTTCKCGDCLFPEDWSTLCGDNFGLIAEIYAGFKAMANACLDTSNATDPGPPDGCLTDQYLDDLAAYMAAATCCDDQATPEFQSYTPNSYVSTCSLGQSPVSYTYGFQFRRAVSVTVHIRTSYGSSLDVVVWSGAYSDAWAQIYYAPVPQHYAVCPGWVQWWATAENDCDQIGTMPVQTLTRQLEEPPERPPCTPGETLTLLAWTVRAGAPTVTLTGYGNWGSGYNGWRIIETGYGTIYAGGGITADGWLVGLPDTWTPPYYAYHGFMELQLTCS